MKDEGITKWLRTKWAPVIIGAVGGAVALFVAHWALANMAGSMEEFDKSADLVTTIAGIITLFLGFGAWVAKAYTTPDGLMGMTGMDSATPAFLTIAGAVLLAT